MAIAVQTSATLCLRVGNLALHRIGVSKTIAALTDQTREALTLSLHWDSQFKACLRQHPWPFATKYAALSLNSVDQALLDAAVAAGTTKAAINGDWTYAYDYPDDAVFARRIVEPAAGTTPIFGLTAVGSSAAPVGRQFSESPPGPGVRTSPVPFRLGREADKRVIYTNATTDLTTPTVDLEYTAIFDCPEELVDELFVDALAWRFAALFAPALSRLPQMGTKAWQMYLHTLDTAAAVSAREAQQQAHGEAEWIRARA